MYFSSYFVSKLPILMEKYPDIHWRNALDMAQIQSKLWVLEALHQKRFLDLGNVMILGGWIGLLGHFLLKSELFNIKCIRSFDIDRSAIIAADLLNKEYETHSWKFKSSFGDWDQLDYFETHYITQRRSDESEVECTTQFDTIINTCCEHMNKFDAWIKKLPNDRLLILQASSDETQLDHLNCFKNLTEFKDAAKLSKIKYSGQKDFGRFSRFMLIGYR